MIVSGEYADEPPEQHLKAAPCLLGRELEDGRLFANDELELGDEVHHQLGVRAQRFPQSVAPLADLHVALTEDVAD